MSSSATSGGVAATTPSDRVAALDLGHDLDVVLQREQAREGAADHRLVLGDQHADHVGWSGTLSRRRNPPSGRAPASSLPAHALRPLGEAAAARCRRGRRAGAIAVVLDLDGGRVPSASHADRAVLRAAVADDVRRALAHGPGEHRVDVRRAARRRVSSSSQSIPAAASADRAPLELVARATCAGSPARPRAPRASASRVTVWMSSSSAAARSGSCSSSRAASSLLSAITERLWPSRSCMSRAMRSRSSETASSASSSRAACSSRLARAIVARTRPSSRRSRRS